MSIPRQLIKSFDTIRDCKLVVTKNPSEANLKEFGKAINGSVPDESNQISYMIYKFMRGMYLRDKTKFLNYIAGMQYYEAMILWTDYDDILTFFDLTGVIFLGWNKSANKYQAAKIDLTKKRVGPKTDRPRSPAESTITVAAPSAAHQHELHVKAVEQSDDYDTIYARIARLQSTLALTAAEL